MSPAQQPDYVIATNGIPTAMHPVSATSKDHWTKTCFPHATRDMVTSASGNICKLPFDPVLASASASAAGSYLRRCPK